MKNRILLKTNILVCLIIIVGFLLTAVLSYRANYSAALENIEQVSSLTSEGIYHQMSGTFTKPVNISLTMANDSLLMDLLSHEPEHLDDPAYTETISGYLRAYRQKYGYDSVFLVSAASGRYYNFNGLDRVLVRGDPENAWYYDGLLQMDADYAMNVDNDEVAGAEDRITVFVNCKIADSGGVLLGVVGVGVRIDSLQQVFQSYQDEFEVNAYLIDDAGTIQVSTQYTGYEAVNLFEVDHHGEQARQDILSWREAGVAHSFWARDDSGAERDYIVARYLPEIQWHLVVERDTSLIVGDLHRQLTLTVLVIAVIVSFILIVITHVIRSFNRQIVTLTQSVEQERRTVFERATEQLFENIYELDITHDRPADQSTQAYFERLGAPKGASFTQSLRIIAEKQIKEEFRQGYIDMFSPENVLRAYQEGTETLRYEFLISQDGETYYWMRITAQLVRWESDGSLHMLVYRQNIDAEKRQERRMQALAQTDEMTGLLTKSATQRQIQQTLAEHPGERFACYLFDIDDFKQANDRYGHAFGDSVIRAFADAIRAHFGQGAILGRIGGDEFSAFLPVPGRAWAEEKARELSAALAFTHTWGEMHWQVSASIGVVLSPEHGTDRAALFEKADAALYETKKRGKNGYTVFHDACPCPGTPEI